MRAQMASLLAVAAAVLTAQCSGVPLVTFDGAPGTTFTFLSNEDSSLGSLSYGNWSLEPASGVLSGVVTVVDRPAVRIVHASPGYIKASADGHFPDASSTANGSLTLRVRSLTPFSGFRVAFAAGAKFPGYACQGGGSIPFSRGCFKSDNFTVSTGAEFSNIKLPFSQFSDRWVPATGERKVGCAQDPSTCVTSETLKKIQRLEIWAEGASAEIHLEIQSISTSL